MALERQYTEPMQWVDTPEMKDRVERLHTVRRVSRAQVIRELVASGIDAAEREAGIAPDYHDSDADISSSRTDDVDDDQ